MSGRRTKAARHAMSAVKGTLRTNPKVHASMAKRLGVTVKWLRRQLRGERRAHYLTPGR